MREVGILSNISQLRTVSEHEQEVSGLYYLQRLELSHLHVHLLLIIILLEPLIWNLKRQQAN